MNDQPEIDTKEDLGRFQDLRRRTITALLVMPPVLGAVWVGGPMLWGLLVLASGLIAWEWTQMAGGEKGHPWIHVGAAMIVSSLFWAPVPEGVGVLAMLASMIGFAALERNGPRPRLQALSVPLAVIPVICFDLIRGLEGDVAARFTVLWLLFVVWATDIGAYVAGRVIGGPKLMPKVSPKKTWSGSMGGVVAALSVTLVFYVATNGVLEQTAHSLAILMAAAVVLSIASQAGDLVESAVKRHCDFKDSGGLLPGHGGLLDRVDGLIAATVALAAFVIITGGGMF